MYSAAASSERIRGMREVWHSGFGRENCAAILCWLRSLCVRAMFESLSQRLSSTIERLRGQARLTEANIRESLREVRIALLEADVALPVVKALSSASRCARSVRKC